MEEHITENQIIHSNFFTNRNGNTLMKEFEGVLQHNNHIKNLDAVVGFCGRQDISRCVLFWTALTKCEYL